ncbi:MAG: molecular chaperone DnaJ [Dehalococcoidia bacterium]
MQQQTRKDLYEVLGIERAASSDEIKKAFRRLAMEYHPDRNGEPEAEARFKEVNEAYEILSDPEKRQMYDRFGTVGDRGYDPFSGFGGLGDIFDSFFGGTFNQQKRGPQRGADLRYAMAIEFEEAVFGCEKEVEITRLEMCQQCRGIGAAPGTEPQRCDTCNGSGQVRRVQQSVFGQFVNIATCDRCRGEGRVISDPCRVCKGSGRERRTRTLMVKIPAGVDDGSQLRLTGEGEAGNRGGSSGNLYVSLRVREHEFFSREEDNIIQVFDVNVAQAALGARITVPTMQEAEEVELKPGTQTGDVIRLKGRGAPRLRAGGRGDMLVHLNVEVPTNLSNDQKKLLRELADSFGTPVHEDRGLFEKIKDTVAGS